MPRLAYFAVALAVLGSTRTAVAETRASEATRHQVAFAVNPPLRWKHGDAIGGSVYVGLDGRHAVRANFARYDASDGGSTLIGDIFFDGDGSDASYSGRKLDVSVGMMYFPRAVLDGAFFEGGVLARDTDMRVEDDFSVGPAIVITESKTYAVRGLVGWSWLFGGHAFVQLAAGMSLGHETGRETTSRDAYDVMFETHELSRGHAGFEGFVRLGGAFGL